MKNRNQKSAPARRPGNPVFLYTSACCNEPAKKPPVARSPQDIVENKFSECALGHWSCGKCGKPCKVTRSRISKTAEV